MFLGQFNIQTGYGIGTYTIPATQNKNFNTSHRINLVNEYVFNNNFLASINSGIDFHKIDYKSTNKINDPDGIGSREYVSENDITIQTFRIGISIGREFEINPSMSILFKMSYDQYFTNKISIQKGYLSKNIYTTSVSEIDQNEPDISTKEFSPSIDYKRVGYPNKFLRKNRNVVFSLVYRYYIDNIFINASISYSPFNEGFVLFGSQNLFLAGIKVGYTFPQKSGKNEK